MRKYGTRSQVWEGEAQMTRGMLTKDDLIMSANGRLVSKKKSEAAKQSYKLYGFAKRAAKVEEKVEEEPAPVKRKRRKRKSKTSE